MSAATNEPVVSQPSEAAEPSRSWWQFSLRTFFVAITLLALALGWFFTGPEKQRRIIAELRERGAYVLFEMDDPLAPPYDGWIPEAYFKEVEVVDLPATGANACVGLARQFPRIRTLSLANSDISDDGLAGIEDLGALDSLSLHVTNVGARGLAHVAKLPRLQRLLLGYTKVTDADLLPLADCPTLEQLCLMHTQLGDEAMDSLAQISTLRTLVLSGTRVSGRRLAALKKLKSLEEIYLDRLPLSNADIEVLAEFPALVKVSVEQTKVTSQALESLRRSRTIRTVDGNDFTLSRELPTPSSQ